VSDLFIDLFSYRIYYLLTFLVTYQRFDLLTDSFIIDLFSYEL